MTKIAYFSQKWSGRFPGTPFFENSASRSSSVSVTMAAEPSAYQLVRRA